MIHASLEHQQDIVQVPRGKLSLVSFVWTISSLTSFDAFFCRPWKLPRSNQSYWVTAPWHDRDARELKTDFWGGNHVECIGIVLILLRELCPWWVTCTSSHQCCIAWLWSSWQACSWTRSLQPQNPHTPKYQCFHPSKFWCLNLWSSQHSCQKNDPQNVTYVTNSLIRVILFHSQNMLWFFSVRMYHFSHPWRIPSISV